MSQDDIIKDKTENLIARKKYLEIELERHKDCIEFIEYEIYLIQTELNNRQVEK